MSEQAIAARLGDIQVRLRMSLYSVDRRAQLNNYEADPIADLLFLLAHVETLTQQVAELTAREADIKAVLATWLEHADGGPAESPAAWSVVASKLKRLLRYTKHAWDCARLGPT